MLVIDYREKNDHYENMYLSVYPYLDANSSGYQIAWGYRIDVLFFNQCIVSIPEDWRTADTEYNNRVIRMGTDKLTIEQAKQLRDALLTAIEIAEKEYPSDEK